MNYDVRDCYQSSPYKSIKHTTYFQSYEHFFGPYRNKPITFLEIGVLGGGSLFMWREYFGPQARIIGVDLNPNAKKWEAHGFEIFTGSQSDPDFWRLLIDKVGPIDVVLDDGGHTYDQQTVTVESLFDAMRDGGLIVVEDTHTSYMEGFGPKKYSFINYVKNKIDTVNYRFAFGDSFASRKMPPAERRFWSIEIVESMVAFRINREASNEVSAPTENNGIDDLAKDFRTRDPEMKESLSIKLPVIKAIKALPCMKPLIKITKEFLDTRHAKSKQYF